VVDKKFVRFQPKDDEKKYFAETSDVAYLKSQKDLFRILPIEDDRSPNWYRYHLIQSVYGYHPNKLRIYQEMLDAFQMPEMFLRKYVKMVGNQVAWQSPQQIPQSQLKAHRAFLRMLNVKYILCPYMIPDSCYKVVNQPEAQGLPAVYEFRDALPRIFFPRIAIEMQGKENILGFIAGGSFDPAETAIVEEKLPYNISASDSNQAEIKRWDYHNVEILANIKTYSLLTLSEIYYPAGWKAFIDDKETKIYKTDYVLRSVFLEPGEHNIKMIYRPRMFKLGMIITVISFGLMVVGAIIGFKLNRKKESSITEVTIN
jgi:hypothetical protein